MSTTDKEYDKMAKKASPNSPKILNCVKAFLFGGAICTFGQFLNWGFEKLGFSEDYVKALTPSILIIIAAILTGVGVFDKIAKHAGAGTIVPTNVLKLLLVFSIIYVILLLVIKSKGSMTMLDFFNIPEVIIDAIEETFDLIRTKEFADINQIAKSFDSLSDEAINTLLANPVIFNLLSISPQSNSQMIVNYNASATNNNTHIADTELIENTKRAFYQHCYQQGKLSIDDYNKLTNKES